MTIFVVGKSGSGKSTFSRKLAEKLGYKYIDVDKVAHEIYNIPKVLAKVEELFGRDIFDEKGQFDRKRLGKIVFSEGDSLKVQEFNNFTLNQMYELLDKKIDDKSVVDYIKLPLTKYWQNNGVKILVKANDEERFTKLQERDNLSSEYLRLRDKAGMNYNESEFDFIVKNDYKEENLDKNIENISSIIEKYIQVKVLGSDSPYAKEDRACPSYYVKCGNDKILLDCGSGSHRFFNLDELDNLKIIVSHLHRDHYNDIFNYMYTSFVFKNSNKIKNSLKIYLPASPRNIVNDIKGEKLTFSNVYEFDENTKLKLGKFDIEFLKTIHSNDLPSYAMKLCCNNKKIIYTGDLSFASKEEIVKFSKDADLLICESSLLKEHGFNEICSHLTSSQASVIAKESGVKKLLLTHFWPEEDRNKYLEEGKEVFDKVYIAKEKDEYYI